MIDLLIQLIDLIKSLFQFFFVEKKEETKIKQQEQSSYESALADTIDQGDLGDLFNVVDKIDK